MAEPKPGKEIGPHFAPEENGYIVFEEDKAYRIDPKKTFIRLACCDCNRVHNIVLKIVGEEIEFTIETDIKETKRLRRRKNGKTDRA